MAWQGIDWPPPSVRLRAFSACRLRLRSQRERVAPTLPTSSAPSWLSSENETWHAGCNTRAHRAHTHARELADMSSLESLARRLPASHLPGTLGGMEPTLDELLGGEPTTAPEPPRAARKLVDYSDALSAAQAAYEAGMARHGAATGIQATPHEQAGEALDAEVVDDHPIEPVQDEPIDRLKAAEDEVYQRNLRIVNDAARFAEIPYDAQANEDEVPQEWVDELGLQGALVRMRTAKGAQQGAKTAPYGLGMAVKVVTGLAKARAVERTSESQKLNVQIVLMPQVHKYEVLEVAGRDD